MYEELFQHSTSIFIPVNLKGAAGWDCEQRIDLAFWRCANAPANYPQPPPFFGYPLLSQWSRGGERSFLPLLLYTFTHCFSSFYRSKSGVKRNIYVSFNDHDSLKIADGRRRCWKSLLIQINCTRDVINYWFIWKYLIIIDIIITTKIIWYKDSSLLMIIKTFYFHRKQDSCKIWLFISSFINYSHFSLISQIVRVDELYNLQF